MSPKTSDEVLSWTVSDTVFRTLQPPCHAQSSFSWPKISQAKYDENSLSCDPQSLSSNLRLTMDFCWSTRLTRTGCSFHTLQSPYHARPRFSWPKIFRVTYRENCLFWGILPPSRHQKLSLNGSFRHGSRQIFTLYSFHIMAGLHLLRQAFFVSHVVHLRCFSD